MNTVKQGHYAHFQLRLGLTMKRIWIAIITIIIIVIAELVVKGAPTIIDAEKLPELTEQALVIEPIDFAPEPEKPRVEPVAKPKPAPIATNAAAPPPAPVITGNCQDWMKKAGITDISTAHILIMKESGCRPDAVNPSSGACGIGQQLPCGKWPHQWNDPVGAMIDMQNYVFARYGSWVNALNFHYANNWY